MYVFRQLSEIILESISRLRTNLSLLTFGIINSFLTKIMMFFFDGVGLLIILISIEVSCTIRDLNLRKLTKILILLSNVLIRCNWLRKFAIKSVFKIIAISIGFSQLRCVLRGLRFLSPLNLIHLE